MNKRQLVPIVIFCYTRLNLLKRTVSALLKNKEAAESEVFFYSDGGKDEFTWKQVNKVRKYLSTLRGFGKVTIVEQKENVSLNTNLISSTAGFYMKKPEHTVKRSLRGKRRTDPVLLYSVGACFSPVYTGSL